MMQLLSVLAKYPAIAKAIPVLTKYQHLKLADLTGSVIQELAGSLGYTIPGDDHAVSEVAAMLRTDDINNLADLANNPETITKLMDWLSSQPEELSSKLPSLGQFYGALSAEDLA